jgi:hypothetical protein
MARVGEFGVAISGGVWVAIRAFRNNLIHEYREPGYGTDRSGRQTEPFYTNLSSFGGRELVFPIAFVAAIYEQALARVSDHLLATKVSPHSKFKFGSHWRATT